MDSATASIYQRKFTAYALPMAAFLGGLALVSGLKKIGGRAWLETPEYWVYPLQTILCGALVCFFWREYDLGLPRRLFFTCSIALVVFLLWISPQAFLGFPARTDGFNPNVFANQSPLYWPNLVMRFVRLAVVVSFVEEIFWRGFLLRYFIDERFERVAFGTFSWLSFVAVSVGFMLVHSMPDWPAALVTGALYNAVAYWTKSLSSCVLAHALTNLLLGGWIMLTGQWGFW